MDEDKRDSLQKHWDDLEEAMRAEKQRIREVEEFFERPDVLPVLVECSSFYEGLYNGLMTCPLEKMATNRITINTLAAITRTRNSIKKTRTE